MQRLYYLRTGLLCTALAAAVLLASCDSGSSNEQTKETALRLSEASAESWDARQDAAFLIEAYSYGLMIVRYSELALEKAQSPTAKSFAEQSATWHKKLNNEIEQMALHKEVALPDAEGANVQRYLEKLNKFSSPRFEQEYLLVLSDIQSNMMHQYEIASDEAMDMNMRNWASQTLPYMQAHAQAVNELQDQLGD
ncbi:outer membrane protein [Flammeovirgaceae bacterium 311]|nr:outer membrane protein [Flammeovirgaceae bacterium 311]